MVNTDGLSSHSFQTSYKRMVERYNKKSTNPHNTQDSPPVPNLATVTPSLPPLSRRPDKENKRKRKRTVSHDDGHHDEDEDVSASDDSEDDDDNDNDNYESKDECVKLLRDASKTRDRQKNTEKNNRSDELAQGILPRNRRTTDVSRHPKIRGKPEDWSNLTDRRMKYWRYLGLLKPPEYAGCLSGAVTTRAQKARQGKPENLADPASSNDPSSSSSSSKKRKKRSRKKIKMMIADDDANHDADDPDHTNEKNGDDAINSRRVAADDALEELEKRKRLYENEKDLRRGIFEWNSSPESGEGDVILGEKKHFPPTISSFFTIKLCVSIFLFSSLLFSVCDDALVPAGGGPNFSSASAPSSGQQRNDLIFRLDFLSR